MHTDDAAPSAEHPSGAGRPSTRLNGLIGGLVGIVLGFIPLSPVLGGAIAGYLGERRLRTGLRAGVVAGLVMTIAFTGVVLLILPYYMGGMAFFIGGWSLEIAQLVVAIVVAVSTYSIGLAALGGYLGVYLQGRL